MSVRRPVVVITRAAQQAGGLRDRLETAGYDVLEVPVIATADPADGGTALTVALSRLPSYDWVVVTSPSGAGRVAAALAACPPERRPQVAVVGPGTASAVGVPVGLVASTSIGEGLVADFPTGTGTVLLAQAEAARTVVAEGLAAKGWTVDTVVAYRTVPARPPAIVLDQARQADAIVFTSGSTVRHFVDAAGIAAVPAVVVTIGPATSAVAAEVGVTVTVVASEHTLDGVVEALRRVVPLGPPGSAL
jgi:uroporphyrinogen-III synthase